MSRTGLEAAPVLVDRWSDTTERRAGRALGGFGPGPGYPELPAPGAVRLLDRDPAEEDRAYLCFDESVFAEHEHGEVDPLYGLPPVKPIIGW
ncbi:hypothetical protein [Amycolatopsis sp. WQ 127309]|uniref:hypothetical protein n=1 Tax=Amycolatopsis sp. WQ 127309 TaxID=2932773 RepID=UPI001FF6EA22|nr:hypothetical protein [Amycolatopsis sp. WQ 127309]UOZ06969.1 hypothetical protein MUY22_01345 [Amycolatopsis sp. WQ 127309]